MITIRPYQEADAGAVGRLIADTYGGFNLSFATPQQRDQLLGPFRQARSGESSHQAAIARAICAEMVYVAEDEGEVVGILRGRPGRLASLFVRGDCHRQGIGRRLVERFEQESAVQGVTAIKVASTLYAIPFYLEVGYKRTTGIRPGWSFDGRGLLYQPMKKVLPNG